MRHLSRLWLWAAATSLLILGPAAFGSYVGDFESPLYHSGPINAQDGWTTPAAVEHTARILTSDEIATELSNAGLNPGVPVHSGAQALIVSGAGNSSATIRQIADLATERWVQLDVFARPITAGATGAPLGNIFLTMEDSTGDRAAAFRFGFVSGIPTIDYGTNIGGVWQASGLPWSEDTWYRLTLTVDYLTKTYDFAIDGTTVNSNPIPFYTSLSDDFRQIRIFRGANQAGMIVDDLSVQAVPEPFTPGMIALGVAALGVRRVRCASTKKIRPCEAAGIGRMTRRILPMPREGRPSIGVYDMPDALRRHLPCGAIAHAFLPFSCANVRPDCSIARLDCATWRMDCSTCGFICATLRPGGSA